MGKCGSGFPSQTGGGHGAVYRLIAPLLYSWTTSHYDRSKPAAARTLEPLCYRGITTLGGKILVVLILLTG